MYAEHMAEERRAAILSTGEMGSQVARALVDAGWWVATCVEGRGAESRRRAEAAGCELLPDLETVVREAALIISIVPPAAAEPLARAVAKAAHGAPTLPTFIDANAIGPTTARRIGQTLHEVGIDLVDGAIIGAARSVPHHASFHFSGPQASQVTALLSPPLKGQVVGAEIGQASALKVLYAGMTKGITALSIELLAGAHRFQLLPDLLALYEATQPGVAKLIHQTLPELPPRAERRSQEMAELSLMLGEMDLSAATARAAEAVLAAVGEAQHNAKAPEGRDLSAFLEWWSPPATLAERGGASSGRSRSSD